jgi:hypothetical protein
MKTITIDVGVQDDISSEEVAELKELMRDILPKVIERRRAKRRRLYNRLVEMFVGDVKLRRFGDPPPETAG